MSHEELQAKFPYIEHVQLLNNGWDVLLLSLYGFIHNTQSQYVEFVNEKKSERQICGIAVNSEGVQVPALLVSVAQVKEKFGSLRIYVDTAPAELDWNIFDKEKYEKRFATDCSQIDGYISAMEAVSGMLCEKCGERGTRQNVKGWLMTLCEKCYAE